MAGNLVSVCIPCHNAAAYVGAAIESILAQSWTDLEIIVVNDGSTDGSKELLESYDNRRILVIHQDNQGQCAAANRAYREAQGEWIKFFDADDLLAPESIQYQVERIQGRKDAIASAQWGRFYGDNLLTFRPNTQSVWRDLPALDWLVQAWADAQPMMQCGLWLIPRTILEKSREWDESLSLINDFEFFARVLCHAQEVLFTPEATLYYRSGIPGSLSSRKTRAAAKSAFDSIRKGTSHLLSRRSDAEARLSCANIMQNFIYTFYPDYPDLCIAMSSHIAALDGSNLPPPGGPWFQRARRLIGWKAARRLQRTAGRF